MPLPGILSVIADGQLRIPPTVSGPKLTILGTTDNTALPLLEPIAVTDGYLGIAACNHLSGDPSELSLALEEALLAGAQNIEVVVISNTSGELGTYSANTRWDDLESAYAALRSYPVDFIHPAGAFIDTSGLSGTDPNSKTRTNFGKQLADYCHLFTSEGQGAFGIIGAAPILKTSTGEAWAGAPSDLSGELFATPSRVDLTEWTYHLTGSASGDDHSTEELTTEGFVAGSSEESAGQVSTSYDFWARNTSGTIATDQFGTNVDGGGFLAVVAACARIGGPSTTKLIAKYGATDKTTRNTNGAGSYAGFLTTIDPHVGSTNKSVQGLIPAREFNRSQVTSIVDGRIVTLHTNTRGYVVAKGVTGAYNASTFTRSDFVMVTTRLITNAAMEVVARASEPFIGEPNNEVNRNGLEAAIDAALRALQIAGAVRRYDFRVESTPYQQILGEASVYLTIVPALELTNINIYVALGSV